MTNEYYDGILEGLERFAWMRDGVTYVGCGVITLKAAKVTVENERKSDPSLTKTDE